MRLIDFAKLIIALAMLFNSDLSFGAAHYVKSGQSIQQALDRAQAGDKVFIEPGVYEESLHLDTENILISGVIKNSQWPTLDGKHSKNDGIIASGSGFVIENMIIKNFKGNGVTTQGANNVTFRNLRVEDTGIYGIYPTLGNNISIVDTVTFGIEDAGIYIGMCDNVDVRRNVVYNNVAGIEVENSLNVLVEENSVFDNTSGILVFTLPGLPRKKTENIIVRHNFVFDNNHRNFGIPGSVVGNVPPGSGILVLAADSVIIEKNIIKDNSLAGIALVDLGVLPNMDQDPLVEPNPDGVRIMENLYIDNGQKTFKFMAHWYHFLLRNLFNGGSPEGADGIFWPEGADVYFSGKGQRNCLQDPLAQVVRVETGTGLGVCDSKPSEADPLARVEGETRNIETMINRHVKTAKLPQGEQEFAAVCAGCHAFKIRAIGPSITEIQEKYSGNPEGIVKFALSPEKVRNDFPEMPSQAHLGEVKLSAVAKYVLQMRR